MLHCAPVKGTDHVKVTFTVPVNGLGGPMAVVGDFNAWDPTAAPLAKKGSEFRAVVAVEAGKRYAFRYLAEGGVWFNDEAAHDYQLNEFGGSDSVLDLTDFP